MKKGSFTRTISGAVLFSAAVMLAANAQEEENETNDRTFQTDLSGYEEVPTLSTPATGTFSATVNEDATQIEYQLGYSGFTTPVQQAHLHLGRPAVNGGIIIFLCSNLPNPPPNTPVCPETEGEVSGTLTPEGVIGPEEQGITEGEFEKLLDAMRNGAVYVNVHTEQYPPGEIRGQLTSEEEDTIQIPIPAPDTDTPTPTPEPGAEAPVLPPYS